jgi:Trk-type K+ transport system membrane component
MDSWSLVLLGVAGYVAVTALVQLMIRRRNELADELLAEAERERRRNKKKSQEMRQGTAAR